MDDPRVNQRIMDGLSAIKAEVRNATLVCNRENLISRWENDRNCEWRTDEWLNVSLKSLPSFSAIDHVIDTSDMSVEQVAELIMQ